jgi:hypothetical protein
MEVSIAEFETMIDYNKHRQCFKSMPKKDLDKVVGAMALFKLLDQRPDKDSDTVKGLQFHLYKRAHVILFYYNQRRDIGNAVEELDKIVDMLKAKLGV